MQIHHVTVLGGGVLGSQIAYQSALHGYEVTIHDLSSEAIVNSHRVIAWMIEKLRDEGHCCEFDHAEAQARIGFTTVLADAVRDADLVIESVPEKLDVKREVYRQIATLAPPHAIFATNTSTLLPSALADATGRPDRFVALHFANEIWRHNIAEVMPHPATAPSVISDVAVFAESIGMVPVRLNKEQPGYILNSLLVPLLSAAAVMLTRQIATHSDIDRTWKIGTGAPMGPFEIFDVVGLRTVYNIMAVGSAEERRFAEFIKEHYLDKGHDGVASGQGFYSYPARST